MEGVPFDWNDYLSSEGISDIAPTQQAGQDGCVACLESYETYLKIVDLEWNFRCRVTGCSWNTKDNFSYGEKLYRITVHEWDHSHYGKPGNLRCLEADCKFRTKRWSDLRRHASSKHCINPQTFKCPDLNCKYHQQGFTRKDKLNSHFQKVHGGKLQRGKPNQAILPKVGDSA